MKGIEEKPRIRTSRQRQVILRRLKNMTSHPTAGDIYDMVRQELPRVSLGTIYRNLEILARDGHIRKLDLDEGQKRFDGRTQHHYHMRCLACGRVVDIDLPPQVDITEKANSMNNCLVTGHKIEFSGICPRCRKDRVMRERRKKDEDEESRKKPHPKIFDYIGQKGGKKDG